MKKILLAWILILSVAFSLAGCGTNTLPPVAEEANDSREATLNLLSAMIRQSVESKPSDEILTGSIGDFSLSLLQNSYTPGENTILSPYSVYLALAMVANGAKGETLSQIESSLGMTIEELNPYALYLQTNQGKEMAVANSVWIREGLSVQDPFLQSLKNYYDTQVFSVPFEDSTLDTINHWIREETNGRISQALDQMNPNAMLYLINALTFDASWSKIYTSQDINSSTFFGSEGEKTVEMMTSTESVYLDDGMATGFLKDYEGGQYSFMALLPNEGISPETYLASLTGESLLRTIAQGENTKVIATMPKVQLETTIELRDVLTEMGMVDPFTMDADLSGINGDQDLFLSRVLHKTYLQVDEAGTQAGAVTIEEIVTKGLNISQKVVFLNRPYVMGIYDKINGCFLFLGTVENP